jgi:hypothetical protein
MTVPLTIVGALLVVAALQDVFHTLFHPAARGDISDWIALRIWRVFRRWFPRMIDFAGPLAFVAVVGYWLLSTIVGFALIYYPRLPRAFTFAPGLSAESYASFAGALNISVAGLMTASTGVYSTKLWLQLLIGIEAVFGFALLTTSISWILSIYPVLEHRRSLAHEATLLHFAEASDIRRLEDISDSDLQQILLGLASQLTTHRNELTQFPITYFFYEDDQQSALAGILPYLSDIAHQSVNRGGGAAIAATVLGGAIDDYLKLIAGSFLNREFTNREDILRAYAEDQNRQPVRSPGPSLRKAA